MKYLLTGFVAVYFLAFASLQSQEKGNETLAQFSNVEIEAVYKDTVSIRALNVSQDEIFFAGSKGKFGHFKIERNRKLSNGRVVPIMYHIMANQAVEHQGKNPEFRSVASTSNAYFFLSVENPALLYRYNKNTYKLDQVYTEEGENVFYDSMAFWNDNEGIAMGDPTDKCLSIIITRDGGKSWQKISCDKLPKTAKGEAAFAASNSNIAIEGNQVWIISGGKKSRVFHSADKGQSWKVYDTPIVQGQETTGGYSIDFYDEKNGFIVGGDYTNPTSNAANKAVTRDGGKNWELVADGSGPGYMSSVKYVPNSGGKGLVAVGDTGVFYSANAGTSWKQLSTEAFNTIEFVDATTAYAAGNGMISRLTFR